MSLVLVGFGRKPPDGTPVRAWYGARTISSRSPAGMVWIDYVPDRQQLVAESSDAERELFRWIKREFVPWLQKICKGPDRLELVGDGGKLFKIDDGPFHAEACAQRSCGYCYVGAWLEA